jgi:uncharacterized protein YabN with tetrapyrrole methylase and pyrophosphatase domain
MENLPSQSSNGRSTKALKIAQLETAEASPFEILCGESEQINPAIILAEKLMRKDLSETFDCEEIRQAEETINASRREIGRVESQFAALVKTPAFTGSKIPIGF